MWTRSTGSSPRKRRDITEQLLKAKLKKRRKKKERNEMKSVTPIYKRKCVYLIENVQGLLKYDIFYDVCLYCLTTCAFIIILQNGGDEVVQTLHGLEKGLDYAETIVTCRA